MKRKPALVWDEWNREHIQKHGVTIKEIEEAYKNEVHRSESYLKRQVIFGVAISGRPITIAVSYAKQKGPYVCSARIMSISERRKYLW